MKEKITISNERYKFQGTVDDICEISSDFYEKTHMAMRIGNIHLVDNNTLIPRNDILAEFKIGNPSKNLKKGDKITFNARIKSEDFETDDIQSENYLEIYGYKWGKWERLEDITLSEAELTELNTFMNNSDMENIEVFLCKYTKHNISGYYENFGYIIANTSTEYSLKYISKIQKIA